MESILAYFDPLLAAYDNFEILLGDPAFPGIYIYWLIIALSMIGFYIVLAHDNLVKKIVGLNVFQVAVFLFYITLGKVSGGTAPILADGFAEFSNPLPHVLILTAIVVGVATTALGLALVVRINRAFGSIEDDELQAMEEAQADQEAKDPVA